MIKYHFNEENRLRMGEQWHVRTYDEGLNDSLEIKEWLDVLLMLVYVAGLSLVVRLWTQWCVAKMIKYHFNEENRLRVGKQWQKTAYDEEVISLF